MAQDRWLLLGYCVKDGESGRPCFCNEYGLVTSDPLIRLIPLKRIKHKSIILDSTESVY